MKDGDDFCTRSTEMGCDTWWMPAARSHRHVVSWADCADAARSVAHMLRWFRELNPGATSFMDSAAICDVAGFFEDECLLRLPEA